MDDLMGRMWNLRMISGWVLFHWGSFRVGKNNQYCELTPS